MDGHHPLRVAHRGASARAPENTLAAFREAIRLGADAIELDVQLSADGVPMVIHDDTVDRTTNGHGSVACLASRDLRRLDAGAWFSSRFRGERIPTLEEALECARGRCGLNIEIKEVPGTGRRSRRAARRAADAGHQAVARAVAQAVARTRFKDLLLVSSFSSQALVHARAAMPGVYLGLLASRSLRGLREAHRRVRLFAVHPHTRLASARRLRLARRLGLAVVYWTVNDVRLMRRLLALGGDGLMTDDPALFQEVCRPA
ncbi:MAG TPA: glycerophosphodiester phosphodiesterase family protein [Candidatus Polarisedimenticolia bacterium]|nr:glycerophosphodiester phosphodiesterase family protein [Candidatus Polarisedimenticolia bacterium]